MQKITAKITLSSLRRHANPSRAQTTARFFKTGDGDYGAGDKFLGLTMAQQRAIARECAGRVSLGEIEKLLASAWHEARMCGLLLLVDEFIRGDEKTRTAIYKFYVAHPSAVNNWDLVDSSAAQIVGAHLLRRDWTPLKKLARSTLLWERRIAIVATYAFIRARQFEPTLKIAALLLGDRHDLIHKACGWMLREVGKRDGAVLEKFLRQYGPAMPRTALRYAIEKFDVRTRKKYLKRQS